jgi:hypothetical protein
VCGLFDSPFRESIEKKKVVALLKASWLFGARGWTDQPQREGKAVIWRLCFFLPFCEKGWRLRDDLIGREDGEWALGVGRLGNRLS